MRIEALRIKNYKVFKDVEIKGLTNFAVLIGRNGTGKTTFFDVFAFLNDCLSSNVRMAIDRRGGYKEVLTRGTTGDIEFALKFRPEEKGSLLTYELVIGEDGEGRIVVRKEILRMRRGRSGAPWKVLAFANGEGVAAAGKLNTYADVRLAERRKQRLASPDVLAIKGLGQFQEFSAVTAFRKLIEDWFIADLHVDLVRERQENNWGERLSRTGDNLAAVAKYLYDYKPAVFADIINKMQQYLPGIAKVEAQKTQDGYIVLKFHDRDFSDPFAAKFASDGTLKLFTYLVLLNDPERHALLCIEEPESQLYPELLAELAEEFKLYSVETGQVFVSTHSPDFLNAIALAEVYCLVKKDGYSTIVKATDNKLALSLYEAGDLVGSLWKQGLLTGE